MIAVLLLKKKMVDTGVDLSGKFDKSEKGRGGAPMSIQKFDKGLTTNVGNFVIYRLEPRQTRKFLRLKNGRKGFQHQLKEI